MRYVILWISFFLFFACTQHPSGENAALKTDQTEAGNDINRQHKQAGYQPGLGEIMSGIQMHHAKLWFAGINRNWPLADFEIKELQEAFGNAEAMKDERKEAEAIPMIYGSLDSVNYAIQQKDPELFKHKFLSLTNTCNSCHKAVNFGFNVVTIPTAPPVTNQDFSAQ